MGFSERFPRWITAVLGVAQLLLTAAIIGLELGSVYIDLGHGTIWAGFWSSSIFFFTFMTMLFVTCCCRGRCCAFYVLILNILSIALACVLIYFDQLFMKDPCKCFLGNETCCALRGIPAFQAEYDSILASCATAVQQGTISSLVCQKVPYDKVVLLKAQLGCAVGMLVSCLIYVIMFLLTCFGVCFKAPNRVAAEQ